MEKQELEEQSPEVESHGAGGAGMNEKLRHCEVSGEKGYFHRWVDKSEIVRPSMMVGGHNGGRISATLALVEFEDGRVEECYPHRIVFKDRLEVQE